MRVMSSVLTRPRHCGIHTQKKEMVHKCELTAPLMVQELSQNTY